MTLLPGKRNIRLTNDGKKQIDCISLQISKQKKTLMCVAKTDSVKFCFACEISQTQKFFLIIVTVNMTKCLSTLLSRIR